MIKQALKLFWFAIDMIGSWCAAYALYYWVLGLDSKEAMIFAAMAVSWTWVLTSEKMRDHSTECTSKSKPL